MPDTVAQCHLPILKHQSSRALGLLEAAPGRCLLMRAGEIIHSTCCRHIRREGPLTAACLQLLRTSHGSRKSKDMLFLYCAGIP